MEQQGDHILLLPLPLLLFKYGYRCFWLFQSTVTQGMFSQSLIHSLGHLYIVKLQAAEYVLRRQKFVQIVKIFCTFYKTWNFTNIFTTTQDWVFIIQLLDSYLCTYKTKAVAVQELQWLGLGVASVLQTASLLAQLLFLLQCQSPPTSQDPGCNINKTCKISLCMFMDKRNQPLGSKIHVSTLLVSNPVSRLGAKSVLSISHFSFMLYLFLNWPTSQVVLSATSSMSTPSRCVPIPLHSPTFHCSDNKKWHLLITVFLPKQFP